MNQLDQIRAKEKRLFLGHYCSPDLQEEYRLDLETLLRHIDQQDANTTFLREEINRQDAEIVVLKAEIERLKCRLNHQTEDDVANCKRGLHGDDCGAKGVN